jgi:hypothetical protein
LIQNTHVYLSLDKSLRDHAVLAFRRTTHSLSGQ